jgi:hypothetical protein
MLDDGMVKILLVDSYSVLLNDINWSSLDSSSSMFVNAILNTLGKNYSIDLGLW